MTSYTRRIGPGRGGQSDETKPAPVDGDRSLGRSIRRAAGDGAQRFQAAQPGGAPVRRRSRRTVTDRTNRGQRHHAARAPVEA